MEKSVDHVLGEMSGPAHSSTDAVDEEEEADEEEGTTRYRLTPSVDGKPYSLAMHNSIDPIVG